MRPPQVDVPRTATEMSRAVEIGADSTAAPGIVLTYAY